jgi:hypothetical protein
MCTSWQAEAHHLHDATDILVSDAKTNFIFVMFSLKQPRELGKPQRDKMGKGDTSVYELY